MKGSFSNLRGKKKNWHFYRGSGLCKNTSEWRLWRIWPCATSCRRPSRFRYSLNSLRITSTHQCWFYRLTNLYCGHVSAALQFYICRWSTRSVSALKWWSTRSTTPTNSVATRLHLQQASFRWPVPWLSRSQISLWSVLPTTPSALSLISLPWLSSQNSTDTSTCLSRMSP